LSRDSPTDDGLDHRIGRLADRVVFEAASDGVGINNGGRVRDNRSGSRDHVTARATKDAGTAHHHPSLRQPRSDRTHAEAFFATEDETYRHHQIREWADMGMIRLEYIESAARRADILAKSLPRPAHTSCVKALAYRDLHRSAGHDRLHHIKKQSISRRSVSRLERWRYSRHRH
jgi:hypothetical protein